MSSLVVQCATQGCPNGIEVNDDHHEMNPTRARAHARKRGWLSVVTVVGDGEVLVASHCPMHWPGGGSDAFRFYTNAGHTT